jgi:hypothetical protein
VGLLIRNYGGQKLNHSQDWKIIFRFMKIKPCIPRNRRKAIARWVSQACGVSDIVVLEATDNRVYHLAEMDRGRILKQTSTTLTSVIQRAGNEFRLSQKRQPSLEETT